MRIVTAFIFCLFVAACSDTSYFAREIEGEWFSQDWLRDDQSTGLSAWMKFTPADSSYRAVFGESLEGGKYWIDGHRLYTHASGAEAIKVKIELLEDNIMHIGMNRGGQKELIIFERKQK